MSEWSDWYRVIKETGPGRKYLYLQRVRRVPGQKNPQTQSRSLGRVGVGKRPRTRTPFDAAAYQEIVHVDVAGIDVGELLHKVDKFRKSLPRKPPSVGQIGLALLGDRDEYDRPRDSLLNRMKDKQAEAAQAKAAPNPEEAKAPDVVEGLNEGAGAGNGEASDSSE